MVFIAKGQNLKSANKLQSNKVATMLHNLDGGMNTVSTDQDKFSHKTPNTDIIPVRNAKSSRGSWKSLPYSGASRLIMPVSD